MKIFEHAVFKLKTDKEAAFFREIEPRIKEEARERFPSLRETATYRVVGKERTYAHLFLWDSLEEAHVAMSEFPTLPSAAAFMDCIEESVSMDHLEELR